jgi:hypothetical protein
MKGSLSSILLLLRMRMPACASRIRSQTSIPRSVGKTLSSWSYDDGNHLQRVGGHTESPATDRSEISPCHPQMPRIRLGLLSSCLAHLHLSNSGLFGNLVKFIIYV